MQLVINTYGSYLHRDKGCFELKSDGEKTKVSTKKVDSILITTGASISTDAIKLALDNNIEIQFLDQHGRSVGKVWHSKLGSTTYIRRRQLEITETEEGTELVKEWILRKIDNCIEHLNDLGLRRSEEKKDYVNDLVQEIKDLKNKLKRTTGMIDEVRNSLMGYEGNIGRKYFAGLSYLIPERYEFSGRSFRPAEDEFNSLLNYGYGVLYSKVEKACIIAGLDPYVGILHTDDYNKKSFVFDVIEPYRHHIDRIVMKLFSRKKVRKSYFDEIHGGVTLNEEGKKLLIKNLNEYFDKRIRYDGRDIKINDSIQYDLHKIANRLIEK
ncbi:CRISPR-associated endonuclease Cas1 [Sporohalobacter salinus]|uniref:CRISPR-associated endonuclease Cas1 n=1 Tax=Sporohalobacter salinus TaxID=1494606 RepID=UPI00195FFF56|nr:CRISPR-associated endonuclease Cas1 [Sporohalobacter salinus]MBM7624061.1 CRISPR-associated protein Cas1 [Sporohalobacter salinus]